jgi:hypothetical protein
MNDTFIRTRTDTSVLRAAGTIYVQSRAVLFGAVVADYANDVVAVPACYHRQA